MSTPCIICGASTKRSLDGLFDDRYGYPGTFTLLGCPLCGHRMLAAEFEPQELVRLYTDFYPRRSMEPADYRPSREAVGFAAWLDGVRCLAYTWVPRGVRVLDIGCGFGEALGYHAARGCDVHGVEADANVRRVADAFGFKIQVGLFDPGLYEPSSFDYVTMDQVIEHVTDPIVTLKGVGRVLKAGGIAVISTLNGRGWGGRVFGRRWINWHAPYHLQFFTRRSMRVAAEAVGLTVASARVITSSEWLYYQWLHLVTYPRPGAPSVFWSGRANKSRAQEMAMRLLWGLHRAKFDHVVTRMLDAIGLGDNIVYVLRKT